MSIYYDQPIITLSWISVLFLVGIILLIVKQEKEEKEKNTY